MSQIFDALQRSEAERNGKEPASAAHAIELLQGAETLAPSSRAASETPSPWNAPAIAAGGTATAEATGDSDERGGGVFLNAKTATSMPMRPADDRADGPLQCEVIRVAAHPESHLVSLPDNNSPASEAFHLLGVRLRHLRRQRPLKKVLVTSTIPQEGKSVVAANLACTLALRTQQRVLLLEGDVRRPTQSKIFGIPSMTGVSEWLNGEKPLVKSMYRLEGPGIWIFPAGMGTGNSLELLQSGAATPMMEQLMNWFDWVVIDSPPILPLADTSVWTNLADGILLVTRHGVTQKKQLRRGLEALGTQKLIGAVLNSAQSVAHTDYYYRPTTRLPNEDAED